MDNVSQHPVQEGTTHVDLRHALLIIAQALDYVGIDDINHGHRVAYMAYECAKKLNWSAQKCQFTFFAGLVHDCGVSSSQEHVRILKTLQPEGSENHCLRGQKALEHCSILSRFSCVIRYHHTPWHQMKTLEIPDYDKDIAALVFLADRLDFLRIRYLDNNHPNLITLYKELIVENLLAKAGDVFEPHMAETMANLVGLDGFWYAMDASDIEQIGLEFPLDDYYDQQLDIGEVNELAMFLARIVDAKSPFTFNHSVKVAQIAVLLAKAKQLPQDKVQQLYIAGLLHDVGKLKTPDEILNKPGKLSKEEYSHMRRHSMDTRATLKQLFPDSKIGEWASNHHERIDGSGYPFRLQANELDLESRIMAVADVFQALTQKRPYRGILPAAEVFQLMDKMVAEGKLDESVYAELKQNQGIYYQVSTGD